MTSGRIPPRQAQDASCAGDAPGARAERDRRFRILFEQAPFSVQLLARDGRTLAVNRAWEALWCGMHGDGLKDYVLREYDILADPQLAAKGVTERLRRAFGGESVELPTILYDPAELGLPGRARLVEAHAHPVRDDDGSVIEVMLIHEDVTERERTAERLRLATRAGGIGIWEWDVARDLCTWSDEVYALHGLPPGAFGGRAADFVALVHPDDREAVGRRLDEALRHRDDYAIEFRALLPDGDTRWLSTWALVRRDASGRAVGLVGATIDVDAYKRTEAALRASEERLRLAAQAVGVGLFDYDPRTGEAWWSPEMRALYGVDGDAALPREVLVARIHPEDRPRHAEAAARALDPSSGGRYACEYRVGTDRGERWVRVEAGVAFDRGARPPVASRVRGVAVDVTEQRRAAEALREAQERFRLVDESSALGTFDTDLVAGTVRFSPAARRMLDLDPDLEAAPRTAPYRRVHPEDLPRLQASVAAAMASSVEQDIFQALRVVHRDGSVRWIEMLTRSKVGVAADGTRRVVRFWGVLWDVTEQRQLVESLREADRRKDEFLAMLAHELRNPLAPVVNALRVIERGESLSAPGRRALGMAQRQAAQMTRLVDDLLEVSRITRGKIELRPQPMSVGEAVHAVVESLAPLFEARRHAVSVVLPERPVRIVADPVRVAQVLENLLHNAAKYTADGGEIRVQVAAEPAAVRIRVADNGVGIAPEKLPQLFELFSQIDATLDRSQGGLGIGLALVKRLAELHGGTVHAHSDGPGKGAAFTVVLPSAPARARAAP